MTKDISIFNNIIRKSDSVTEATVNHSSLEIVDLAFWNIFFCFNLFTRFIPVPDFSSRLNLNIFLCFKYLEQLQAKYLSIEPEN